MLIEWAAPRVDDLAALVAAALPAEELTADELGACCWDDPGVVLGHDDGAVAAVVRELGGVTLGWLKLLVVAPGARRRGLGRELRDAGERWCWDHGAAQVRFGGSAPFYLWPGIDTEWMAGLCLAEDGSWRPEGAELNLGCPTTHRHAPPEGVDIRRLLADADVAAARELAGRQWAHWVPELDRGIRQGGAFGAFAGDTVVGFACHSVNRDGWIGPMAANLDRRVPGVGSALLGALCEDLMVAGRSRAEISWIGPARFYAKAADARVSRVFRTMVKDRP